MPNSITNTLFRFTSLRSPELLSDEAKALYFVQHPNPTEQGHFADVVNQNYGSKEEWLETFRTRAEEFSTIQTADELRDFIGEDIYSFATWLAKNKGALKTGLLQIDNYSAGIPGELGEEEIITLWDNLFCQLLLNNNPSLREKIIQAILANYGVRFNELGYEWNQFYAVKVVLPKGFFYSGEENNSPAVLPVHSKPLEKIVDKAIAKSKSEAISIAIEEVKKAKQIYDRQNKTAYDQARQGHDEHLDELIKDHTVYNEETRETFTTPFDAEPFSFVPAAEMNTDLLSANLSASSVYLLQQTGLWSAPSFAEAIEGLTQNLKQQSNVVFKEQRLTNRILTLGGIPLILNDDLVFFGQPYGFLMKVVPLTSTTYKVFAVINMGYVNADVASALYHAVIGGQTFTNGVFTERPDGNALVMELFPSGLTISQGTNSFRLHGQITMVNGIVLSFDTTVPLTSFTSGTMTAGGLAESAGESEDFFVPSGFGVKRLGIADYRKVEQTTCCYVPGEVSHIENIMAKEYKERSTRRLRRLEETTTSERQTEKEQLTDSTTTDRFEMQEQVMDVLNRDTSISGYASFGAAGFSTGGNFATNTSQQQSNSQAVTFAKDVTERALDRVVQKVREERITKILEEFEESNKHGFDNKFGTAHISGVYRWVDKIYKNKIFNYGKRLMYEFMIPQPARFHEEAVKTLASAAPVTVLEKPVDPRTAGLPDFRSINEGTAAYWAGIYNAEIEAVPAPNKNVSKGFRLAEIVEEIGSQADKIEVPEGYTATQAIVTMLFSYVPTRIEDTHAVITVGDQITPKNTSRNIPARTHLFFSSPIEKEVGVAAEACDVGAMSYSVTLLCNRTEEHYQKWQLDSFNALIEAYNEKLDAYNQSLEKVVAPVAAEKAINPRFYRQLENIVLKKNCMHYLVPENKLGLQQYSGNSVTTLKPNVTKSMDQYAALVKFMEQAFEWDEMSYNFYPFYWGEKTAWQSAYQKDVQDALFRSFLQAGMARAVVTVRPGFEEAVMHFMATGQVWNGGETPIAGDDLYLSIVDELKNPTYYVEEEWETRVPTTLTLLQSGSVALNATGLPCDCGDTNTGIIQSNAVMIGDSSEGA